MDRSLRFVVLLGASTLAACASKDAAKPDSAKVAQTGAAATSMYDPATRTATVHAKDFAFVAPDSIPAGWTTFHLVNDGPNIHHLQIVRLDSGKTASDLAEAMKKGPPRWAVPVGGANAPNPSSESNGTVNLAPGNYVMICVVDAPDHVMHAAKGMVHPFTVTPSTVTGTEPAADVTVSLTDYAFAVTGALSAGHHTIKVENKGPQVHELELARFAPGKTMRDLAEWAGKLNGPPPVDFIGGVPGVIPSGGGSFTVDLTPGNYVLLCFFPDAKDNKPHVEHGMAKEFAVK